ncbi:hypothetical protein F5Y00DRAFT_260845 [Daldinia vernicosa]|uniref:uncharacterized protein n=1 Tax=Daldinia vernicosa TaxID=114800 RepID=UPI0020087E68|nr:uncharacterized protein F5Y00DRAFT_260845 [Daldinia vernicosa]KAI0850113.1 hypothetical protein F5Y00DRAFT_260845 [Daldinia vernicosa]
MNAFHDLWPTIVRRIVQGDGLDISFPKRSIEALVSRTEKHGGGILNGFNIGIEGIQLAISVLCFLAFSYVLGHVFLILASVETDAPASYTQVPGGVIDEAEGPKDPADEEHDMSTRPVTGSLRSTYRRLLSIGGKKSLFRGLSCFVAYGLASYPIGFLLGLIPFVPGIVSAGIASLITMQLHTAWTHIVISEPSAEPFWRRLPRFDLVLRATAIPTVILGSITGFEQVVIRSIILSGIGLTPIGPLLLLIFHAVYTFIAIVPAEAVLARVQASLLPEEDRPIISLDAVFDQQKAEGKEYISTREAYQSLSRATWKRLYMLHVKYFGLSLLVFILWGAVGYVGAIIARKFHVA